MKILLIHSDFIEFEARQKAIKAAEEWNEQKKRMEECLVVFTAVEKRDEADLKKATEMLVKEIKDVAEKVKTKNIVLYPYAHLSSSLSSPRSAQDVLEEAEKIAEKATLSVKGNVFHRKDIGTKALIEKRVRHVEGLK